MQTGWKKNLRLNILKPYTHTAGVSLTVCCCLCRYRFHRQRRFCLAAEVSARQQLNILWIVLCRSHIQTPRLCGRRTGSSGPLRFFLKAQRWGESTGEQPSSSQLLPNYHCAQKPGWRRRGAFYLPPRSHHSCSVIAPSQPPHLGLKEGAGWREQDNNSYLF